MPRYVGYITWFPRVAGSPDEPATTPLSADCFAIACWAMDDLVILAHIREQHRLSLQSYGRPRMTEELQELGLKVGHRRVERLMGEDGIKIIRTQKYKATTDPCPAGYAEHAREGATTRSTSHQICWIKISQRLAPIRNGLATSATSGPVRAGCILPSSLTCILAASSAGLSVTA